MDNNYKTTKIIKIFRETQKIKTYVLDTKIQALPGQYVMLWLPQTNEKPYSIGNNNPFTLTVAKVGEFTEKFHQLKVGDTISYRGPYGTSYSQKGKKVILIGGGYGVVPLYFQARALVKKGVKDIRVIIGAKSFSDICYIEYFKKLKIKVITASADGKGNYKGFITDLLTEEIKRKKPDAIYGCGSVKRMLITAEIANKNKIFCEVSLESYFKCGGMGICGECAINGVLLCKEGPVVNAKKLSI